MIALVIVASGLLLVAAVLGVGFLGAGLNSISVSQRRLSLADQLRQFSDVGRDASRLIAREQIGRSAPSGLGLEMHVRQRLSVVVADDETTAVVFLNVPRWGETAWLGHGHGNLPSGQSSTTTRITATTAKVRATATMVCWLI